MNVQHVDTLTDRDRSPRGLLWDDLEAQTVSLDPVPNDAVDSSPYVMDTFDRESFGAVDSVSVRAVHDDERIALNLRWADGTRDDAVTDTAAFADKAAVAFPLAEGASVMTMGSARAPVNAWYWRADRSAPWDVLAEGFGDVSRREAVESGLTADATYDAGRWHVTFERALSADGEYVDLTGPPQGVSFAVWDGSNAERGPLKAYSGEFSSFSLGGDV